jgi:hypothetical protein
MTASFRRYRRWLIAIAIPCFVVSVAANCRDTSSPTAPTDASVTEQASATPQPTATDEPTATPTAIDRSRLPVQLHIPGAPDESGTPVAASPTDFGDYLHVVDLAEGTARLVGSARLAAKPDSFNRPLLSPDHTHIAYPSRRSIVVIEVATGREQAFPLPAAPPSATPCGPIGIGLSWAPDSASLAINTEDALLVLDRVSGSYREIVHNTGTPGACAVAWSPDAEWIVFSNHFALLRVRPDGSDRLEGSTYYGGPSGFIWAPDSTRFFFSGIGGGTSQSSFVSDPDLRVQGIPDLPLIQALSTSGTRVAYHHSEHDEKWNWTSYIETRDVDGTNSRTLVTSRNSGSVAYTLLWSADDAFIAYPQRVSGGGAAPWGSVRVVNSTTGEDLTAALGPASIRFSEWSWVVCDVNVVGWLSTTSLVTWTTCETSI